MYSIARCLYLANLLCPFLIQTVAGQTSSAIWQFPVEDGLIVNTKDAVNFQWRSDYDEPWLQLWCEPNAALGSSINVKPTGNYTYVIAKEAPSISSFPVACHAALATARVGGGVNDPVGVTFVSLPDSGVVAKTFALAAASSTFSASTSITLSTSSTPSSVSISSSNIPSQTTFSPKISLVRSQTVTTVTTVPSQTTTPQATVMSTGAKAGISIGVILGVGAMMGAVSWLLWKKRRSTRAEENNKPGMSELGDGSMRHELNAFHRHYELDVRKEDSLRHELNAPHGQQELVG